MLQTELVDGLAANHGGNLAGMDGTRMAQLFLVLSFDSIRHRLYSDSTIESKVQEQVKSVS